MTRTYACLFGIVLATTIADAQVIQKWKKPDGSLYFGNKPPAGSVKIGETGFPVPTRRASSSSDVRGASPEATPADFSVQATSARKKIERTLRDNAARLTEIRDRMKEVSNLQVKSKADMLNDLEAERRKRYAAIADAWAAFENLNAKVVERYGEEPDWWRSTIICGACPTREEAAAASR